MENMIRFAHPHFLYALALVPLLAMLYLWSRRIRKKSLQRFGNPVLMQQLSPASAKRKAGLKFMLLLLSLTLLIIALANPQIGTRLETVKREGVDLVFALDISNSMKAEDFRPNRLENAKRQISLLLQRLQNDRVGIVIFAGNAFLQLPLTTDYSAAQLFLSSIDTDFISVQGTAIGSAIRLGMKSFVRGEKKHRVILVISDGEDFEEDAIPAAREAAADGIVLHAIGMGSPQGVPIPIYQNGVQTGFKKDDDGNVVITRLNETLLQQIADAGKGRYLRAANRQDELETLFKDIEGMEKKQLAARVYTEFEDRFQYPLGAAVALLLLEFFVSERRTRRLDRWKSLLPGAEAAMLVVLLSAAAYADSERSLVRQGNRLYDSKQYTDAEVNYRKALEKNKKLREGEFNLGDALYKQGRFEEAEKQFRLSAESAPDAASRAQSYHNLGNALLKSKKLEDSIESYKQALKLNPDQDTRYNLEYARRLLQQQKQQQQQQNQQQNKDQKKQNKDQKQKQDQSQKNDQKKDQKQDQNQQQQPQEKPEQQEKEPAPPKKDQISQQDAERILEALKNEEKNVQKKLHKTTAKQATAKKDW